MKFEVVLNAYRHLRWDGDAIRRVGHTFASVSTTISLLRMAFSSPHHVLPLVPYHSYTPGSISRLVQINAHRRFLKIPAPRLTPSTFRSCASLTSSVSSSYSSPCSRFSTLPPTLSTSDDKFALLCSRFNPYRVAIKLLVIAKDNGSPSAFSLTTASAPSSRPSCNHFRVQWNGRSRFLHDVHRESPSTKPMRANSHPPLSPHHTKPLTLRSNVHPPSLNPLLHITPSFFHFPTFPSVSE